MRLHLNLDHLLVPGAEQRARHAAARARMFRVPPKLVVAPVPVAEPEPPPPPPTVVARWVVPDKLAAAIVAVEDDRQPHDATDAERVAWMARRYTARLAARPWERRLRIAREVGAQAFGCSVIDLICEGRRRPIVHYRMIVMAFSWIVTGNTLNQIGKMFGGRDHTTVLSAINRFGAFVEGVLREEGVCGFADRGEEVRG